MYSAKTQIRVRYAETDQMSYVYYGNYATYYEVARVEALRQLGFDYAQMEEQGVMMPVLDLHSNFHKAAKYDELLTIEVIIPKLPAVKMLFEYKITNLKDELINSGSTTLVFLSTSNHKPVRAPETLLNIMKPFYKW